MNSSSTLGPAGFRGRERELALFSSLIAGAREARSAPLVVSGEAGVGKSALLDCAVGQAMRDFRIERVVASEAELELAYSGLQMLVGRMLKADGGLPTVQRAALESALGLREGGTPNPFIVGLAVHGILAHLAEERRLMCIIDDAHWLDQASARTLAFVARRLSDEGIVMIFAMREVDEQFADLPQLRVTGLGDDDALDVLNHSFPGVLDTRVRDQVLTEARGNPLALQVLPHSMTAVEPEEGRGPSDSGSIEGRIEQSLLASLETLSDETRQLILLAAADPTGDPDLLWRASEALGLRPENFELAVQGGALILGPRVAFRHPLIRSAVYRAAPVQHRRLVHAALAEASPPDRDPDRRAWHRASAALLPDEDVASALERSAERARARGGMAADAAFLQRAAELSPTVEHRARRLIAAASAKHDAGSPDSALRLLDSADDPSLNDQQKAEIARLRARARYALRRDRAAPKQLLQAARDLEPFNRDLARDTYMEALTAALSAGRLGEAGDVEEVAEAILATTSNDRSARAQDLILRGQALLFSRGQGAARPTIDRALRAFIDHRPSPLELHWMWSGARAAQDVWDSEGMRVLARRQVEFARAGGVLTVLPAALNMLMVVSVFDGHLDRAESICDEIDVILSVTGHPLPRFGRIFLAAYRGDVEQVEGSTGQLRADGYARGEGYSLTVANFAEAIVYNGAGRYDDALKSAREELPYANELGHAMRALLEIVEAGTRTAEPELAEEATARLDELTRSAEDRDWGMAMISLARAQLSDGSEAEALYREAIQRFSNIRVPMLAARSRLLYGEMLRRMSRLVDARDQLREARRSLRKHGMTGFAARAERELRAAGERVRGPIMGGGEALTEQELSVARFASEGLTNREIATRMFISARTAEYHLRKVFVKLGITSRTDLKNALRHF